MQNYWTKYTGYAVPVTTGKPTLLPIHKGGDAWDRIDTARNEREFRK